MVGDRKMAVFDDIAEGRQAAALSAPGIDWKNGSPVAAKAEAEPVPFPSRRSRCARSVGTSSTACATRATPRTDGAKRRLRVLRGARGLPALARARAARRCGCARPRNAEPMAPPLLRPRAGYRRRGVRDRRGDEDLALHARDERTRASAGLQHRPERRDRRPDVIDRRQRQDPEQRLASTRA